MATEKKHVKFDVRSQEDPIDGTLEGLIIQRTERISRESDNGRTLDYGQTVPVGDPLEVPASRISELVGELANWLTYYATGAAAREQAEAKR